MKQASNYFRFSIKHLLIIMTAIAAFYSLPEVFGIICLAASVFAFLLSIVLMIAPILARLNSKNRSSETANEMIWQLSIMAICSIGVFLIVGLAEFFRALVG